MAMTNYFAGAVAAMLITGTTVAAPPNIVIILADDLGYGDLGCYGSKEIRTPNIDRLAKQGVRLTDCYSAAPVCTPTRAALLTGRYPQHFGFDWVVRYTEKDRGLPATGFSLAKQLKSAGYSTALFGKWHLGYKPEFGPNAHGFEQFFGFLAADLDFYAHKDALGDPGLYENTKLVEKPGYLTDLFTERAVSFLNEPAKTPFFLEVAYNAPHWPFQPPDKPDERTKDNYGPETGTRADYIAMVERIDRGVGQILDALDKSGLAKDTIVIFTSDNGGERLSDNGPFFHGKYTLWEGGIRVPAIMRWPDKIPADTVSKQPVITMDWTATMISFVPIQLQEPIDGMNVLPILTGNKPVRNNRSFHWRLPRPEDKFGMRATRRGNWKYIADRDVELLFDLVNDPGERHNLAAKHPDVVAELCKAHAEWDSTLPKAK